MELKQISQSCYYTLPDEFGDRPTLGYVRSRGHAILIDAGNSEAMLREVLNLLEERNLPSPDTVYLTHSHWDHTFGLSLLDKNVKIISTTKTSRLMETDNVRLVDTAKALSTIAIFDNKDYLSLIEEYPGTELDKFCLTHMYEEYGLNYDHIKFRFPNLKIAHSDTQTQGTVADALKMIVIRSPHSSDSSIYFHIEDKILYLGDSMYDDFNTEVYSERDITNIIKPFYRKLEKLSFHVAIPSHSPVLTKEQVLKFMRDKYNID